MTASWPEPFEAFAARKEERARRATICPFATDLDRADAQLVPVGNEWSRSLFDGRFHVSPAVGSQPTCSLVFVQSADGNTGAADPATLGGGETDKHLIYEGLSRVAADAVLAGAATMRTNDIIRSVWHPALVGLRLALGRPRHPVQIVATRRGLDPDRGFLFNVPEVPVIVLTTTSCARTMRGALDRRPWVTVVEMERPGRLPEAFAELRRRGIARISCIGGRTIATALLDAGLIDDVYLTTSPRAGGEPGTRMYPRPLDGAPVIRKRGTGLESGIVFEHIHLARGSPL
jgi:riboflavin biosynthesis pyrimidine reductase